MSLMLLGCGFALDSDGDVRGHFAVKLYGYVELATDLSGSSSCTLRRSMLKPFASSCCAMSAEVTEPKRCSFSPTLRSKTSAILLS